MAGGCVKSCRLFGRKGAFRDRLREHTLERLDLKGEHKHRHLVRGTLGDQREDAARELYDPRIDVASRQRLNRTPENDARRRISCHQPLLRKIACRRLGGDHEAVIDPDRLNSRRSLGRHRRRRTDRLRAQAGGGAHIVGERNVEGPGLAALGVFGGVNRWGG